MANPQRHGGGLRPRPRARLQHLRTRPAPEGSACDNACPMRLNPRNIKRMMFSCVQCGQCLTRCDSHAAPRSSARRNAASGRWALDARARNPAPAPRRRQTADDGRVGRRALAPLHHARGRPSARAHRPCTLPDVQRADRPAVSCRGRRPGRARGAGRRRRASAARATGCSAGRQRHARRHRPAGGRGAGAATR